MLGIRYVVIGLGDPNNPATDEDCEALADFIGSLPVPGGRLQGTVLSERVSNKLTLALLQERGEL